MPLRRPKSNKNPPIFSHEFIIQNHADIVSCIAMVFVIGLMFQATNPVASLFVALQHNVTLNETEQPDVSLYTTGLKDAFTVFFYLLICVVVHAIIQEYILDKLNRRMHLSKIKHSKFNESGQLATFYLASAIWGMDIIIRENYLTNISSLWEGYPHVNLPMVNKLYFIVQLAYWFHCFPELYFQKIKKEEMSSRIQYAVLYLVCIAFAYALHLNRVALCLLVLHYTVEFIFHISRLFYFSDKTDVANAGFMVWKVLFVLVRLVNITLAVLTFWHGLEQTSVFKIDVLEGNYNTQLVRIACLSAVCLLQAWMMWNFITFHLRRNRERNAAALASKRTTNFPQKKKSDKKSKAKQEDDGQSGQDSPRAGYTENGSLKQRATAKSRKQ